MAIKQLSKRAQTFSLISILMSSLFVLIFSTLTVTQATNQDEVAQTQSLLLRGFTTQLDQIMQSVTAQSAFPILNYTINNLNTTAGKGYYDDYTKIMESCLFTGVYEDTSQLPVVEKDCTPSNSSFAYNLEQLFTLAETAYGVDIEYTILGVSFDQIATYEFSITTIVDVRIERQKFLWEDIIQTTRSIDIIGLYDPTTFGTPYERTIQYAPDRFLTRSSNINGSSALLNEYIDNAYYYREALAPSFLDRIEGVTIQNLRERNTLGIAGIIPADAPDGSDLYRGPSSAHLDFIYTSNTSFDCTALVRIQGIDDEILLQRDYVVNDLRFADGNNLYDVCNCCDAVDCNDGCT